MIIGIDPGQTGAICSMVDGRAIALRDMPTCAKLHGKGQEVNAAELASILMEMKAGYPRAEVVLEQVGNMARRRKNAFGVVINAQQGSSSMFSFGDSFGVIRGVCGALQLPIHRVRPEWWKKKAGLIGKEKDAARTLAIQLHPEIADMLTRKKDTGRADAILIARFGL